MVTNKDLDRKLEFLLARQALIATVVAALITSDKKRKEFVDIFNKAGDIATEEE